jgi:hypothetical protein
MVNRITSSASPIVSERPPDSSGTDRDTMQQIRVSIDELERIIEERVKF